MSNGTASDDTRRLSIFMMDKYFVTFRPFRTTSSSIIPSTVLLIFAIDSSGTAPIEASTTKTPAVFFTLAPREEDWRGLRRACFDRCGPGRVYCEDQEHCRRNNRAGCCAERTESDKVLVHHEDGETPSVIRSCPVRHRSEARWISIPSAPFQTVEALSALAIF